MGTERGEEETEVGEIRKRAEDREEGGLMKIPGCSPVTKAAFHKYFHIVIPFISSHYIVIPVSCFLKKIKFI